MRQRSAPGRAGEGTRYLLSGPRRLIPTYQKVHLQCVLFKLNSTLWSEVRSGPDATEKMFSVE